MPELIRLGNCGSPIDTEAGGRANSPGVGPMGLSCLTTTTRTKSGGRSYRRVSRRKSLHLSATSAFRLSGNSKGHPPATTSPVAKWMGILLWNPAC